MCLSIAQSLFAIHNVPFHDYTFLGPKQRKDHQRPSLIMLFSDKVLNFSNTSV
jgi:hypothetical protein